MPLPELVREHPLVAQILDDRRDHARGDDAGWDDYRGHAYRVLNFARALAPESGVGSVRDEKLAIAGAFHDLDAFSSLDYLAPSIRVTRRRTCAPAARLRKPGTEVPTADGACVAGWRAWHESEF